MAFPSFGVSRADPALAGIPGVEAFGHRHMILVDIGDGWEKLTTASNDDPPELALVTAAASAHWGEPVLSGYMCDCDCVEIHWARPGARVSSTHLPDPTRIDCGYRHHSALPASRAVANVVADLTAWAQDCGRPVDTGRLTSAVGYRFDGGEYMPAGEQFDAVLWASGFDPAAPPRPYLVDPFEPPLDAVTYRLVGLAYRARVNLVWTHARPLEGWEQDAIALEHDIFAAAFTDASGRDNLVARAEALIVAEHAATAGRAAMPRTVEVGGQAVQLPAAVIEQIASRQLETARLLRTMRAETTVEPAAPPGSGAASAEGVRSDGAAPDGDEDADWV